MSDLENVDTIVASKDESFGGILKLEREKKGLSIDDVCDDLHLDKKIIYALENHNLEDLPEPAFVCGYIRNYARFLKLQPEPIVEDFKKEVSLSADISAINTVGDISYNRQEKRSHYLIFFLLIIVVVGGYFGWELWKNNSLKQNSIENKDFTETQTEDSTGNDSLSSIFSLTEDKENNKEISDTDSENLLLDSRLNEQATETNETLPKTLQEAEIGQEKTLAEISEKPVVAEEDKKLITETRVNTSVDESFEVAKPVEELASELEKQVNSQSSRLIEKQKKVVNQKRIKFSFSKDSWISVKDANNKSLVYDLMRAGEELELKGAVPIRIFLGDATGVSLLVEEEDFDLSGFINRKNIAKFNVN